MEQRGSRLLHLPPAVLSGAGLQFHFPAFVVRIRIADARVRTRAKPVYGKLQGFFFHCPQENRLRRAIVQVFLTDRTHRSTNVLLHAGGANAKGLGAADGGVLALHANGPPLYTTSERKHLMIRKLKFIGLALVAVFAMSAIGASAASAAVELHSEGAPVNITGAQEGSSNAFDVQFGAVVCTTADYNATTTVTTDTTVTFTPKFEGCTFAGVGATVDTNGCTFVLHVLNATTGTVTVECGVGQEITVTGGTKCIVHVPGGQDVGTVTLTNIGTGTTREVTANLNGLTAIKYTQTPGTGVGKCESLSKTDGKYTGTATFTGETDPATGTPVHTGLFVE